MRMILVMAVVALGCVLVLDSFFARESLLTSKKVWLAEPPLVRIEVGSSCPLFYPEENS